MSKLGTYEHQDKLPHLPVPKLEESLKVFLDSVEPLLTPEELDETKRLASDLLTSGEGATLQALLEKRADDCRALVEANRKNPMPLEQSKHPDGGVFPDSHWLERWWETLAYLGGRDSLCCYLNVFNPLYESKPNQEYAVQRTAWTIAGFMDFYRQCNSGKYGLVPPEMGGKIVLCSAQYGRMFGTTRVPGKEVDDMVTEPTSKHICVERRGHWYSFIPFGLTVMEIAENIEWIKRDADERGPVANDEVVASLTAENRTVWAEAREHMMKNSVSRATLKVVESSAFNVVLSELNPVDPSEVQNLSQHHNAEKIWFDKSLSIIAFENGVVGTNLEHTAADAVVPARMIMYAAEFATQNGGTQVGYPHTKYQGISGCTITSVGPRDPLEGLPVWQETPRLSPGNVKHLEFELDERMKTYITQARLNSQALLQDNNLCVITFDHFGAKSIIDKTGIPTDSFMQMCLALSYARDQRDRSGELVPPTYETAMTRGFYHGRTETIRSQSIHSKKMVEAFDDPSVPDSEKARLFREAAAYHRNYLRRCMGGRGCDRHLMGLKLSALEAGREMHPFFLGKAYIDSTNFRLSTSQLPWGAEDYPGFGAPGPDAYGACYRFTVTDKIRATLSSRTSCRDKDSRRFRSVLTQTLLDVMKVTSENRPPPKSKL